MPGVRHCVNDALCEDVHGILKILASLSVGGNISILCGFEDYVPRAGILVPRHERSHDCVTREQCHNMTRDKLGSRADHAEEESCEIQSASASGSFTCWVDMELGTLS